jgi:CBS domain-containing protein
LVLYRAGEKGTVADLMRTPVITCERELGLPRAAGLMVRHEIHRLVVVDPSRADGVPVGILSTAHVVAEMAYERSDWQHAPA